MSSPVLQPAASDAERACVELLGAVTGVRVVTELPERLEAPDSLPIVQVIEVPGGANLAGAGLDTCLIEYETYAVARAAAKSIAETCRQALIGAAGWATGDGGMWISRCVDTRKPTILFYDEASDIRRYGGQVRLYLRYRLPAGQL